MDKLSNRFQGVAGSQATERRGNTGSPIRNGKLSIQHEGRIRLHVKPEDQVVEETRPDDPCVSDIMVNPQRERRVSHIPPHLNDYFLNSHQLESPPREQILGQNLKLAGGSVVNLIFGQQD